MIRCEATTDIARTAADVFAFLDDASRTPSWMGLCVSLVPTSPPPKRTGTTLRYSLKQGSTTREMDGAVAEYEPGRLLVMRFADTMFAVALTFEVASAGAGARVRNVCEIEPLGFLSKMMVPMIRELTEKQVAEDTARLKTILESGAIRPPA